MVRRSSGFLLLEHLTGVFPVLPICIFVVTLDLISGRRSTPFESLREPEPLNGSLVGGRLSREGFVGTGRKAKNQAPDCPLY